VRVRLAPSPTGDPHVGTAYIGVFNYAFAKANGGDFILRIEDTDRERSTKESEEAIFRALRWVGLPWDEGPDVGGPKGPYRQSERADLYREAAQQLIDGGGAYRCFCTRERLDSLRQEQKAKKMQFGYDRHCREIPREESDRRAAGGEPFVVRLAVPLAGETSFDDLIRGRITIENRQTDDQVLLKSDGFPTYHLANVVDDHAMEITHVIRAEEWISSTPKHVLLYDAFGWQAPVFAHMPLLRNPDRSKISKRKNPVSLDWYREEGYLPEALRNFLALMGFSMSDEREVFTSDEMIADFDWGRVGKGAPVFDLTKLQWLNGEYIRAMDLAALMERLEQVVLAGKDWDRAVVRSSLVVARERMKTLKDYETVCGFIFAEEVTPTREELIPKKCDAAGAAMILENAAARLAEIDWNGDAFEAACRQLAEEGGWKAGSVFMVIRVAVTGSRASPPLFESMDLLGRERSLARMRAAIALLTVEEA